MDNPLERLIVERLGLPRAFPDDRYGFDLARLLELEVLIADSRAEGKRLWERLQETAGTSERHKALRDYRHVTDETARLIAEATNER